MSAGLGSAAARRLGTGTWGPMGLRRRWRASTPQERVAAVGLLVLCFAAAAVRLWFVARYRPAFLGFEDSHEYVIAAAENAFRDPQHPAGYPLFLKLVHLLSDTLSVTIVVQHAIGIATGVVLFAVVRRAGGPPWLGLLPAAVVFFGGTGLFLEHALLADPLFAFLQALGLYAVVRTFSGSRRLIWSAAAGLAIGASFWVKTVGLSSGVIVPLVLLLGQRGSWRAAALAAGTCALVVLATIVAYVGIQDLSTGYFGYERQSAWNLYGRVATFVDCSRFTPPPGTAFLCPPQPLGQRGSQNFYQYSPESTAVQRFGGPSYAPPLANTLLKRFSVAAIEHEPVKYAKAILRGFGFYISAGPGEGYDPQELDEGLLEPNNEVGIQPAIASYYPRSLGYSAPESNVRPLDEYEEHTRIQGALLVVLLAAAVLGGLALRGRARAVAVLCTLTALGSIVFAIAGNSYDARYAYPTFGPLTAGAALGAWGLWGALRGGVRRLRARGPGAAG